MRMSLRFSSARREATSSIASRPNADAAMNAFFCATASCLPIGRPHWTRSFDHSRAIFVAHLDWPTQIAGSARRPVFRVDEGDLEAPALLADQVLRRHEDVLELGDRVLDPLQAHERVAVQ